MMERFGSEQRFSVDCSLSTGSLNYSNVINVLEPKKCAGQMRGFKKRG